MTGAADTVGVSIVVEVAVAVGCGMRVLLACAFGLGDFQKIEEVDGYVSRRMSTSAAGVHGSAEEEEEERVSQLSSHLKQFAHSVGQFLASQLVRWQINNWSGLEGSYVLSQTSESVSGASDGRGRDGRGRDVAQAGDDPNHRKLEINPKTESSRPTHPKMEGYPKRSGSGAWETSISLAQDRHLLGQRHNPTPRWCQHSFPAISFAKRFNAVASPQPKSLPINAEGLKPPPCGDICSMAAEIAQDAAALESPEDRPVSYHDVIRSLEAKAGIRTPSPLKRQPSSASNGLEPESTRKRTHCEESLTSPEPPRKKICHAQSSHAVRRFLDVAAVEVNGDDEEDDPDEDDDDFIDVDKPRHDFCPQPNYTPLLPDDLLNFGPEGDELKKVAQRIIERNCVRRHRAIPKPTTTFPQNLHANCNADLDRNPGLKGPPMLVIRTAHDHELALVRCLLDSGLVLSAGTTGVGSQLVFVELAAGFIDEDIAEGGLMDVGEDPGIKAIIVALQIWARNFSITWDYRNSVLIPPADRHRLLRLPGHPDYYDPFGATNSWVRLQTGRYKGDIALIEAQFTSNSPETLLVVPQIPYDDNDLKKPLPRLFDPNRFLNANPTASLSRRNQTWLWKETKRVFGATSFPGLEQILNPRPALERQPYDLAVVPTENELDYFRASRGRELNLPFTGDWMSNDTATPRPLGAPRM
ncbi:hypothetical protein C8F01DRAFT_1075418 [Mycena amicta]|nr:hypothetical protein C8F01DRAFT_1075418 [Mycena amicta]